MAIVTARPTIAEPEGPLSTSAGPRRRLDGKRRFSPGGVGIWLALTLLIVAPVVSFLVLSVSPRVFQQGPEWFTTKYITQAFQGYTGRGIFDSLWVSTLVSVL